LGKLYFLQFLTRNTNAIDLNVSYENKQFSRIDSTKILGLIIDNNLSWHSHIDQMITKLNNSILYNQISETVAVF